MGRKVMIEQPLILKEGFTPEDVRQLEAAHKVWQRVNIYENQLNELFEIEHPGSAGDETKKAAYLQERDTSEHGGVWVYYPWSGVLLHCVGEEDLYRLQTNRNKNLITAEEQARLRRASIGVLGLSVGNSIALTLAQAGFTGQLKLADRDVLETPNLNRLRAPLYQVGIPKVELAARQLWEFNPFIQPQLFEDGVTQSNLGDFFSSPVPALIFDEMDDFPMKINIRLKAREAGVPVIMLTSLGDNILIDIERFDIDKNLPLFNGLIGDTPEEILRAKIGERETIKYAMDLVGTQYIPARALETLFEINRTLVGRPQLASTIAVDGGIAAFLARRLALGEPLPTGRYFLQFDKAVGLEPADDLVRHQAALDKLKGMLEQ
jgi:hypothetical protein